MKKIRRSMVLGGLLAATLVAGTAGTRAQELLTPDFAGTVTLPLNTQWGAMFLPAGTYKLYYGVQGLGGSYGVEVVGKAKGSPSGFVLPLPAVPTSATKSTLVCIRDGDALVVRALDMSVLGESVRFALPHGAKLMAKKQNHARYAQLAEGPKLIQRIAVTQQPK